MNFFKQLGLSALLASFVLPSEAAQATGYVFNLVTCTSPDKDVEYSLWEYEAQEGYTWRLIGKTPTGSHLSGELKAEEVKIEGKDITFSAFAIGQDESGMVQLTIKNGLAQINVALFREGMPNGLNSDGTISLVNYTCRR